MGQYLSFSPRIAQRLLRMKLPHTEKPEPGLTPRQQKKLEELLARSRQEREDQELFAQLRAERNPVKAAVNEVQVEPQIWHIRAWRFERRRSSRHSRRSAFVQRLDKFNLGNIRFMTLISSTFSVKGSARV